MNFRSASPIADILCTWRSVGISTDSNGGLLVALGTLKSWFATVEEGRRRGFARLMSWSTQGVIQNPVLRVAVAAEAGTGIALLLVPSFIIELLLGSPSDSATSTIGRIAGAAMVALAIVCWPNRQAPGYGLRARSGMLAYNVIATLVLAEYGILQGNAGKLLWPALLFHAIVSVLLATARLGAARDAKSDNSHW